MRRFAGTHRRYATCCSFALAIVAGAAWLAGDSVQVAAQQQTAAPPQAESSAEHGGQAPQRGALVAYPDRPKAPQEVIDRGKAVYSVNCGFCHGSDAGGGSVGPNLWRSEIVLQDQNGELIGPIIHGSRVDRGMPKFDISDEQVSDVAAWLHSLKVSSKSLVKEDINIVVGNATAGKSTFSRMCGSCHKVDGDLKGFAARYQDPRAMQQAWLMPGGGGGRGGANSNAVPQKVSPVTATVTVAGGKAVTGKLDTIDDFYVAIEAADGTIQRFRRTDEKTPKVEIHDPLEAHRALLRKWDDRDIHDITAYLQSLK